MFHTFTPYGACVTWADYLMWAAQGMVFACELAERIDRIWAQGVADGYIVEPLDIEVTYTTQLPGRIQTIDIKGSFTT